MLIVGAAKAMSIFCTWLLSLVAKKYAATEMQTAQPTIPLASFPHATARRLLEPLPALVSSDERILFLPESSGAFLPIRLGVAVDEDFIRC